VLKLLNDYQSEVNIAVEDPLQSTLRSNPITLAIGAYAFLVVSYLCILITYSLSCSSRSFSSIILAF
jgi:hypothetical protein